MKVLIHDERSDSMDLLLGSIVNHGYKAGIAKNDREIINMPSDERYNVVLTNGGYEELGLDQLSRLKYSSVFINSIVDQWKCNESPADLYLQRPFESSRFWPTIYTIRIEFSPP